ncbi:hypothetical protein CVT25_002517 [Psilocybe cyanescens]|uniref:F-box domain-containing protein n=1 Tax=Psilocybe cyanescens TaxID=93625 RepID=A0A409XUP8_PSICY|nr:hypothetical protein CVT25_002517 [Psilocybe cyanescens]
MPLRLDVPGDGTPPTRLYRRKSLKLTRTRSAQAEPGAKRTKFDAVVALPVPKVPMEILEQIVDFYAEAVLTPNDHQDSKKTAFRSFIKACTLVSKDFRCFILRHFFENISFQNTKHSKALFLYLAQVDLGYRTLGWPAGYSWVRSLSTASFLIRFNTGNLASLTRLQNLAVDFTHSSLVLEIMNLTEMFSAITLPNIVCHLTTMTLTKLPRIDVHLLTSISENFPKLIRLHVSSIEGLDDCCPSCYENSQTRMVHSPVCDLYTDIASLTDAFGSSLIPLKNLTHLFIGFFLSRPDLLDLHINHTVDNTDIKQIFVEAIAACPRCDIYRKITKTNELVASLSLARYLDSLECIGWSSCFISCEAQGSKREGNAIEGYHHTNGTDVLCDGPTTAQSEAQCLDQQWIATSLQHANLTTTLVIARTDEKIRVIRIF